MKIIPFSVVRGWFLGLGLLLLLAGCRLPVATPAVDLLERLPTYAPEQLESPSSGALLLPLPVDTGLQSSAIVTPQFAAPDFDPPAADVPAGPSGLRGPATERGLWLGVAVDRSWIDDPRYLPTVIQEFNLITLENALKFQFIHPAPGVYNFEIPDAFIQFAEENGMAMRGHTLVWDSQLPPWVWEAELSPEGWRALLQEHITTVVSRYRGRIYAWDVVNEPLTDEGLLRSTFWLQKIGPEYIALALEWAHAADPEALLLINDHAVEGLNPKSDALYALAQGLLQANAPLHGVGMQAHLWLAGPPGAQEFARNLRRFEQLGLRVHITEMDVRTQYSSQPPAEKLAAQAELYGLIAAGCLAAPNCDTLVVWGLTDDQSWISGYTGEPDAPVLFDAAYQPKPAYETLRKLLEGR